MNTRPGAGDPGLLGRRLALLDRLAAYGMGRVRALLGWVTETAPEATAGDGRDPSVVYCRLARAVRRAVALAARLLQAAPDPSPVEPGRRTEAAERGVRTNGDDDETEAGAPELERAEALRDVSERLISTRTPGAGRGQTSLLDDDDGLDEDLDDDDDEAFFALPFDQQIALICQDLGLTFDGDPFAIDIPEPNPDPPAPPGERPPPTPSGSAGLRPAKNSAARGP